MTFRATRFGFLTLVLALVVHAAEPVRILWAGSSSVYFHDMPLQVAQWLTRYSDGRTYSSEMVGRSGDSIQVYMKPEAFKPQYGLRDGQTFLEKIRDGRYDYVVLQVVTHFLTGPGGDELNRALDVYSDAIRRAGGEPVFYEMGWGLEPHNDAGREQVLQAARRNHVRMIAPCSTAWKRVRAERPDLELQNLPDRTHPGTLGHYLNLAVFYSTFAGRKPDNLPTSVSWWPALTDEDKALARERLAHAPSDPYFRALPEFLQIRSIASREHTVDSDTAAYLRRVAWESYVSIRDRLKQR
jgi:hypothetical protein